MLFRTIENVYRNLQAYIHSLQSRIVFTAFKKFSWNFFNMILVYPLNIMALNKT